MLKRLVALVGVMVLAVSLFATSPAKAAPQTKTLVLHQSHQFDELLSKGDDRFEKRFKKERSSTNGVLTITFSEPIESLAGKNADARFHLVIPDGEKVSATIPGRLNPVETPLGTALFGEFHGMYNDKSLDFTVNYNVGSGEAWVIVSFGAITNDDFTTVPYGTRHSLVDETIKVTKARDQEASKVNAQPQTATIMATADNRVGNAATYHYSSCGGQSFKTGAQYAYVPAADFKYGLSQEGGGRIFSSTAGFTSWMNCMWGSGWDKGTIIIGRADNILTFPSSFAASGEYPQTNQTSYSLTVPVWAPIVGWQILNLNFVLEKVTGIRDAAPGSSRANRLTHTWEDNNIPFFSPSRYDFDSTISDIYQQSSARGFAGYALWSYQLTSSGSDVVWQRGKVYYSASTLIGTQSLTSDSSDVGFRINYGP